MGTWTLKVNEATKPETPETDFAWALSWALQGKGILTCKPLATYVSLQVQGSLFLVLLICGTGKGKHGKELLDVEILWNVDFQGLSFRNLHAY